ncbi:MAG: hypothetical protein GY870_21290 [archaeon]|nr:hypothetical protein [archaeon]
MDLTDIKKKFIQFMESEHNKIGILKNYFGCLIAIMIEQPQPINQDRIEELTGYSKSVISRTLDQIRINYPLNQVKIKGERRIYYEIDVPPEKLMIYLFKHLIEYFKPSFDFVPGLIEKMEPYMDKHEKFKNFRDFLLKYSNYSKNFSEIAALIPENPDKVIPRTNEMQNYYDEVTKPPRTITEIYDSEPKMEEDLLNTYISIKNDFFQELLGEQAGPMSNQKTLDMAKVIFELLIEPSPLTQDDIMESTGCSKSIVSVTLKMLEMRKSVTVRKMKIKKVDSDNNESKIEDLVKKKSSTPRKRKYYQSKVSFYGYQLMKFEFNFKYSQVIIEKIEQMITKIKKIEKNTEESKIVIGFFEKMREGYENYEMFMRNMENKLILNFMDESK